MELFSQRKGIKPIKKEIQIDSMDNELRTDLWNAVYLFYLKRLDGVYNFWKDTELKMFLMRLWMDFFKQPIDYLKRMNSYEIFEMIKKYFFNEWKWYEIYDFLEFIVNNYLNESVNSQFIILCNSVLEKNLSAYRFVGNKIVEMTSKEEISEIEKALEITQPLKGVNIHLKRALDLLSDRKSPDFRNSIKESILAVEAICKLITSDEKATLGEALKKIEEKISIHPALKKAFNNLYGYTSDKEGIRHALIDEPNLNFEDAKFMLVVCSAFINYLIAKAEKAGIKLISNEQ